MSKPPEELIEIKAYQIWEQRQLDGREGDPQRDWEKAKQCLEKCWREVFWWKFRKRFNKLGKSIINAIKLLIFSFWKTLPTSNWIKLLAAPVALSIAGAWITARFQEENRQNESNKQQKE